MSRSKASHEWDCMQCGNRIKRGDLHFGPICNDCGLPPYLARHDGLTPEEVSSRSVVKMIKTRLENRAKGLHVSRDCRTPEQLSWRLAVGELTKKAVRLGLLPKLDGSILCVDCDHRSAICYDHRDYSQPLLVAPVCRNCNASRGKGQMPKPQVFASVPKPLGKKAA